MSNYLNIDPLVHQAAIELGHTVGSECRKLMLKNGMTEQEADEVIREAFAWRHEQEQPRFRIVGDNSGHKYFIPVEQEGTFYKWVESTEEVYADTAYDGPDFESNRIDGRFTFTDPRCD